MSFPRRSVDGSADEYWQTDGGGLYPRWCLSRILLLYQHKWAAMVRDVFEFTASHKYPFPSSWWRMCLCSMFREVLTIPVNQQFEWCLTVHYSIAEDRCVSSDLDAHRNVIGKVSIANEGAIISVIWQILWHIWRKNISCFSELRAQIKIKQDTEKLDDYFENSDSYPSSDVELL